MKEVYGRFIELTYSLYLDMYRFTFSLSFDGTLTEVFHILIFVNISQSNSKNSRDAKIRCCKISIVERNCYSTETERFFQV